MTKEWPEWLKWVALPVTFPLWIWHKLIKKDSPL